MDAWTPLRLGENLARAAASEAGKLRQQAEEQITQYAPTEIWNEVLRIGREALERLEHLDQRAEAISEMAEQVGPALEALPRVEQLVRDGLPVAQQSLEVLERLITTIERVSAEVQPLIAAVERGATTIGPLIESVDSASAKVDPLIVAVDAAREQVDPLISTLEGALPTVEKAVGMAQPLEGAVERLGRALDRMPGKPPKDPKPE